MDDSIEWRKVPEAPLPGPFLIQLDPKIDIRCHDDALDAEYQRIYTPYLDYFPMDIMAEMRQIGELSNEAWLRHDAQIDSRYYRDQSDRRDCIRRSSTNDKIEVVKDYQRHVKETFETIQEPLEGYDIVEEYDLFPADVHQYVLGTGEMGGADVFTSTQGESTLVDRAKIGDEFYECLKQSCEDNVIIEVKDGKAYYSVMPYVYKFKKASM